MNEPKREITPNEDDLDLSDVPEELHSDAENEVDDLFSDIIDNEESIIRKKLLEAIQDAKQVNIGEEDPIPGEPEEELDQEERLRLLMDHLNPEQISRYESYRRTTVNRSGVKKIANTVLNQSVSNNVAIVLSGVSKIFLGEIIERAKLVKERYDKANYLIKLNEKRELNKELKSQMRLMKKESEDIESEVDLTPYKRRIEEIKGELRKMNLLNVNENGPLQPEHIREAWRLYKLESGTNPNDQWRHQGERDGLMFR